MKPIEVQAATADAFRSLADVLSRAFERDPVIEFLFPRRSSRVARSSRYFFLVLRKIAVSGVIYKDMADRGISVWHPPDPRRVGLWATPFAAFEMAATLRGSMLRARTLSRALESSRPREPHWHLELLATEPAHQGRGLGSALLEPVLGRSDAAATPVWLETCESNIPFYERHGFAAVSDITVPGGPRLFGLRRAARSEEQRPARLR